MVVSFLLVRGVWVAFTGVVFVGVKLYAAICLRGISNVAFSVSSNVLYVCQ